MATNPDRVPPLALLPDPRRGDPRQPERIRAAAAAREGARTIPPREHGGNCDIKNLSRGSRIYLPVYVKGAKV